jgi:hypothetical protein
MNNKKHGGATQQRSGAAGESQDTCSSQGVLY